MRDRKLYQTRSQLEAVPVGRRWQDVKTQSLSGPCLTGASHKVIFLPLEWYMVPSVARMEGSGPSSVQPVIFVSQQDFLRYSNMAFSLIFARNYQFASLNKSCLLRET